MSYNTFMKTLVLICLFFSLNASSSELAFYKGVFSLITKTKVLKIEDSISEFKTNTKLLEVFNKSGKRMGFIREVVTSTGCNDGCLPVIFTLFYNEKAQFLRVLSKPGLTKKNHEEFSELDNIQLESIIRKNPSIFKEVGHPTEMVDGITRATLKRFSPYVIKKAAYTTLRVNLYNQQTQKFIKKNYLSSSKN